MQKFPSVGKFHMNPSRFTSFDHLVGAREQRRWHVAEQPRCCLLRKSRLPAAPSLRARPSLLGWSLDLPRRVMWDVHRSIAARASKRRHGYAGKWLAPSDAFVLARTTSDDVGAAVHFRLRLVRVASIKGRENLVTVAIGQLTLDEIEQEITNP